MKKIAFVFPGQGSQSVQMISEHVTNSIIKNTFIEASEILGFDLLDLTQNGPKEKLDSTVNTQPAILCASIALWRLWLDKHGKLPFVVAGHSLGEYSALVASEVIDFKHAISLVQKRGELMQNAVKENEGSMAAILGLDDKTVVDSCNAVLNFGVVSAANFNSPGQVVIAGTKAAVDEVSRICKEKGAKRTILLPVSVPSHCLLMKDAANEFNNYLNNVSWQEPKIPIIQNTTANIENQVQLIKQAVLEQLYSSVKWTATIQKMLALEVSATIECGPGKVLSGLNKKCSATLNVFSTDKIADFEQALQC